MLHVQTYAAAQAPSSDEAALVARLASFEDDAWQTVFQQHHATIVRIAFMRTFNRSTAEDIAAEVFAEAVKGIGRYRYRGVPFRAWLFRLARNITSNHLKAQLRTSQVPLEDMEAVLESTPEDLDLRADFVESLTRLTDDQRSVVVLRLVAECSVSEVAQVLNRSEGAIKQLQHRAIAALRANMSSERQVDA